MSDLADFSPQGWLGNPCHYTPSTASTNDLAYQAGLGRVAEGALFLTDEQTQGRGRFDRTWSAPPGCCLLFSLLFQPQEPFAKRASRITMACGLAMQRAIEQVTGVPALIKWPNDLIVETPSGYGKLAGMLSEFGLIEQSSVNLCRASSRGKKPEQAKADNNSTRNHVNFLVVGIGMNVNIPADALLALSPQAMSLSVAAGMPVSRPVLLRTFLTECESLIYLLRHGVDILPQWRDALAWRSKLVTVRNAANENVRGTFEDVTGDGALQLRMSSGEIQTFSAGDISLRLK